MSENAGPPPARFSSRLNAFVIDASLFAAGYLASALAIGAVRGAAPSSGFAGAWLAAWTCAFVLYHAYFGAEGRQTVGKRAFGISVRTLDGEAPGIGAALVRTLGYALSSLILNLGFAWALKKHGRAWHDLLAGTRVVETSPRGASFRSASDASAWLLGAAMIALWLGMVVIGPGLARMRLLAAARTGLKSLAYLQEEHKRRAGTYTADLAVLVSGESPEAAEVRRALGLHLNAETVRLTVTGDSYAIEAEAHDERRTVLRLEGPVDGVITDQR